MRSLVLGTAGHIDHGKSALVLALTGIDPDRLKEEKARGITIDLGFAHAAIGDVDVSFVDVPGHERFVRTMLAGAGGIDAVVLVVAADESVMPQTREHLAICRLIGVERGLIALTKSDLADADTRAVVALEIRSLVAGTFLERAPILPVSARTGEGLDALRAAIASLAGGPPRLGRGGLVRLPVDRTFSVKGFGTVATGTLVSGAIAKGDELEALPLARRVRVRGVQVHGRDAPAAHAPQRTAVNLAAVEVADLGRGVTLATPGAFGATRRVDARIEAQAAAMGASPSSPARPVVRHGGRVWLYHGTSEIPARVAIAAVRAARGHAWRRVAAAETRVGLEAGDEAFVRLRLERPAVLARLDRIVLRGGSPATTVGGGIVLDVEPPAAGLRRPAALQRFETLDATGGAADWSVDRLKPVVSLWITEAADAGLETPRVARRAGIDSETAATVLAALQHEGRARTIGDRVFDRKVAERIDATQQAVRSAATPAPLGADERRDRDRLEAALLEARLAPPELDDLARSLALSRADIDRLARDLVREGRVVRAGTLCFHSDALGELKAGVRATAAQTPGQARLDVASFKAQYGLSRKFAIPLLEWLDRERVTRRVGDTRIVIGL